MHLIFFGFYQLGSLVSLFYCTSTGYPGPARVISLFLIIFFSFPRLTLPDTVVFFAIFFGTHPHTQKNYFSFLIGKAHSTVHLQYLCFLSAQRQFIFF